MSSDDSNGSPAAGERSWSPSPPAVDDAAVAAAERALLDELAALEYSNSSLRRQLTDAREAAVAHAEARLMAARARHAPRADVERALLDVLSARDAGGAPPSPGAGPEARVRALLTPPSAADWDASDPAAAAALAAGGGGGVADLGGLRVRLSVGPAAGDVSLATMLTWSPDVFAATYGAAGARCAALLAAPLAAGVPPPRSAAAAAAAVYREMRCFTKAWAAAHPASIHAALSLVGFTDASGATFLADGAAAPVAPADAAALQLTRPQIANMMTLRAEYLDRVRGLSPGRAAALDTLERALLGGDRRAAVGRVECVAALDAADELRASLAAQIEAEILLAVGLSYVASDEQCGRWIALRYPRAAALVPLVEAVAAGAGAPPAAAVLAGGR